MLSIYGPRLLGWLEGALDEAHNILDEFTEYVVRWRELLEDAA